jgi:hypothetical protein
MVEIEAGDTLTLAGSEGVVASNVQLPLDINGAGWAPFNVEYAIPTVARTGERFRKDLWQRWRRRRW